MQKIAVSPATAAIVGGTGLGALSFLLSRYMYEKPSWWKRLLTTLAGAGIGAGGGYLLTGGDPSFGLDKDKKQENKKEPSSPEAKKMLETADRLEDSGDATTYKALSSLGAAGIGYGAGSVG